MTTALANRLLSSLSPKDRIALGPHLKPFTMVQGTVLHPAGKAITRVYFPLSGMVSLLTVMRSGQQIETAIVGHAGVVGASIGSHGLYAFGQATVQIAGEALQIGSRPFLNAVNANGALRTAVNRFQSVILMQAQQSAACHALHAVEARLCRWLLQSRDAIELRRDRAHAGVSLADARRAAQRGIDRCQQIAGRRMDQIRTGQDRDFGRQGAGEALLRMLRQYPRISCPALVSRRFAGTQTGASPSHSVDCGPVVRPDATGGLAASGNSLSHANECQPKVLGSHSTLTRTFVGFTICNPLQRGFHA